MTKLTRKDKIKLALDVIQKAIQCDGAHHKQWYLSRVAQCLLSESVEDEIDKYGSVWKDYVFVCGDAWQDWRKGFIELGDDGNNYDAYDEGVAP